MKLIILATFFISGLAFAGQAPDYTIHQEYTSTRALGMGNAFSAVTDDHSAMFYNPAALALRTDGQLRFFLRGGVSDNWTKVNDELDKAGDDTQKTADVIEDHYGEHLYSRVPTIGMAWVRPKWGLAIIPADFSIDVAINKQLGPSLGVNAYLDTTIAYARAKQLKMRNPENKVAIGVTVKALHRAYYSDVVSAAMLADGSEIFDVKKSAEGMTIDADFGLLWSPYFKKHTFFGKILKPTFSAVVRNAGDYGFPIQFGIINKEDPEKPPNLQRRLDLGSKFQLPKFWVFDPKLAIDIRDIGHDNWTFVKGSHAGFELYWQMFKWWKGSWSVGLNQGYATAGFGARLAWFQLDVATWGEEVGTSTNPIESRRYIVEMSIDI